MLRQPGGLLHTEDEFPRLRARDHVGRRAERECGHGFRRQERQHDQQQTRPVDLLEHRQGRGRVLGRNALHERPDPSFGPYATWTFDSNFTGWSALLGSDLGKDTVSPVAVPGRLKDLAGLAPAYVEVGDLDIFRDEDIAYAGRIAAAGIPIELHVHPGAPHGFERMAPQSKLAQRAMADRMRVIGSF